MPCCGVVPKEGRKLWVVIGIILEVLGVILSFSFILNVIIGGVFDAAIVSRFTIGSAEDAEALDKIQVEGDSISKMTVYVYNLTNEADVITGEEPVFESVGPFVYNMKAGRTGSKYDPFTGKVTYSMWINQEFVAAESADINSVITNIDAVYTGMFGAAQPTVTEGGLLMSFACIYVTAIDAALDTTIVSSHYATELAAYSGTDEDFWASKYVTVSAEYGENIYSMKDLLYAQWGGAAMMADGADLYGAPEGTVGVVDTVELKTTIAGAILATSLLSDAQKALITDQFVADPSFYGLGIYQTMRRLSMPCARLSIAKVASIMACFATTECGLGAIGTMLEDTGDGTLTAVAYTMFGLDWTDAADQCYLQALIAYPTMMMPLANNLFTNRLRLEKGDVPDNIIERKTIKAVIEGYESPTLHILSLPSWMDGFYFNDTTPAAAAARGMVIETNGGRVDPSKANVISTYKGVTGFDYNGDGVVVPFTNAVGSCQDGSQMYPPNQKKMDFTPFKSKYEVFDVNLLKSCTYHKSSEMHRLGDYETPIFVRDETACYATDTSRATVDGYQSLKHSTGVEVYVTPACMYGHVDKKVWTDDCPEPSQAEHGTFTAIDSLSGAPWMLQRSSQLVIGFDTSTDAYDMTGVNTTHRYPQFRMKMTNSLADQDKQLILDTYNTMFLLKDTLSWALMGTGIFFAIVGVFIIKASVRGVGKTMPVDSTAQKP